MIKNETRESAHLKSRVKDLSVVPNLVSFTGLFTAITPIAKLEKNPDTGCYDPILIRDTDSLIANFGDPRIDPEKYIDLYSIMQVVGNGTSCYVAKVDSGDTGIYEFSFVKEADVINESVTGTTNIIDEDLALLNDTHERSTDTPWSNTYNISGALNSHFANKYSIGKIIAHPDNVGIKACASKKGSGDNAETLTFTAVNPGVAGNNLKVTLSNGPTSGYKIDVTGTGGDDWHMDISGGAPLTFADLIAALTDNCPITAVYSGAGDTTITDAFLVDGLSLEHGVDPDPDLADWVVKDENIAPVFAAVPSSDPVEYTLSITLNDKRIPKSITIQNSILDPDYGREKFGSNAADDNLTLHVAADEDDPYYGDAYTGKVYDSRPLTRKYNILTIKKADAEVPTSDYTVAWSEENGKHVLHVIFNTVPAATISVGSAAREDKAIIAYSSMAEDLDITCTLTQAKPYSLKLFYLNVEASSNGNKLGSAKVKLEKTTTNQQLINNINSALQTYARFELVDQSTRTACEINDLSEHSIVRALLDEYAAYSGEGASRKRKDLNPTDNPKSLPVPSVLSRPNFKVTLQNYIDAQELYKDRKYVGCLMADFAAPVTHTNDNKEMVKDSPKSVMPLDPEERRSLHYYLKQIACERKDATVILSTPFTKGHTDPYTLFTKDEICDWVASQGDYADLWEYGSGNTTDYSIQSFYLEIYYSWLNMQCTKIENGLAKSVKVKIPPSNVVVNNILTSWRERGVQYPVAGDQGGTLPDTCTILQNPKTKLDRDQLVQYRINPIWDTGTRGIQIYGNETLNAGYTDLNAAHIARTLVYIRSRVDEYTETLKFLINSRVLWDTWKAYVTSRILEPLQSANALSSFRVSMGEDTTSREEIANRMIKGNVELTFYQSAEIFDLSFIVYSSATTVDEANPL